MKIIFLDFDGVLLTTRTSLAAGCGFSRSKPDEVLVRALVRCCDTGVRIVVSSSWRDAELACRGKLAQCGLENYLHADWRIGDMPNLECAGQSRPDEIAEWLARHPEVTGYCILDDDEWNWSAAQALNALKCCPNEGASSLAIRALLRWAGIIGRGV